MLVLDIYSTKSRLPDAADEKWREAATQSGAISN